MQPPQQIYILEKSVWPFENFVAFLKQLIDQTEYKCVHNRFTVPQNPTYFFNLLDFFETVVKYTQPITVVMHIADNYVKKIK